jgi:hypothetical protein
MDNRPESLAEDEICRGKLMKASEDGFTEKSFDILTSFLDVLGKPVAEIPGNYEKGELIVDTAMDLETNVSKGFVRENSLLLDRGKVAGGSVVKMAQTFRSGTNDIDATDYVEIFLEDESQENPDVLNEQYILENFRPAVTNKNWRMDCGVAGYDNTHGLPPFFPTRLRFEDYIYRLWIQQRGIVAAHVNSAQTHTKSNYMRNPPAAEVFNEEIANLLKRKIKGTLSKTEELGIQFDYEGEVSLQDSQEMLEKVGSIHRRVLQSSKATKNDERRRSLDTFAMNLEKAFYGFEPDFFQQNSTRIVDDVLSQIKGSIELWPTLVEICYFQKNRKSLPQVRVKNQRKNGDGV